MLLLLRATSSPRPAVVAHVGGNHVVYAIMMGANKGIGFAICKQLASNGFIMVFTARDEKRGVEAVEKLKELDFIKNQYGKLDILENVGRVELLGFFLQRKMVVGCWLNEICRGKFDVSFGYWLHLTQMKKEQSTFLDMAFFFFSGVLAWFFKRN
ncbi:hypothetical protein V8G54_023375 [Vigna mungo]|uniref:Uncharacterized protein n=1 Tax=Vigna mungo TaxID=3915 RepID=A0AAQ3RS61_VIGMU